MLSTGSRRSGARRFEYRWAAQPDGAGIVMAMAPKTRVGGIHSTTRDQERYG
jgi:hypothetical protein